MAIEKTDAIVLRRTEYSNTSLILSLYGRSRGRIDVIAKGARREKSPFAGALDLSNRIEAVYYRHSHSSLHTLSECLLLDDFRGLTTELYRFYAGSHVLEILASLTAEGDHHTALFDISVRALTELSLGEKPVISLLEYYAGILKELGYLPVFSQCVLCGKDPCDGNRAYFSSLKGGALCPGCSQDVAGVISVPGFVLDRLHELTNIHLADNEEHSFTPGECERMVEVFLKYLTFLLEREPRTAKYMRRIGKHHI